MARRKKEKKPPLTERVIDALDMPKDVMLDLSKITITDYTNITIENYKGIIEYEPEIIRINTKSAIIKVTGVNLDITSITDEDITVCGRITGVEFI